MKKYQIIWAIRNGQTKEIVGSASSKAPNDVSEIARKCGYEEKYVFRTQNNNKFFSALINFCSLVKELKKTDSKCKILLQYPCFNEFFFQFARFFFPKRRYITVIHDLNSIRVNGQISKAEVFSLSIFNEIIVHSPEMKDFISGYLPKNTRFHVLHCFPYLTNSVCRISENLNEVCFAGNLDKSFFLKDFISNVKGIKLKLFGKMDNKLPQNINVEYCGMFNPDDISSLSGSWGLVWDGDSAETCSGTWGEYLKIIAPHKFSLYIAAGIPVIVWSESAMARLVRQYKLGITVSNLSNIEMEIKRSNQTEYVVNIQKFKELFITGKKLKEVL